MFKEPAAASDKGLAYQPVSLSNVGWVRQNFNANLDNLRLLDEQTAQDEIMLFRRVGGQTVVDPTNVSLSRDPLALARIARATNLNIVMGAGYYVAAAHPADMDRRSEDSIVREIVREVTVGVGDTGVRAGLRFTPLAQCDQRRMLLSHHQNPSFNATPIVLDVHLRTSRPDQNKASTRNEIRQVNVQKSGLAPTFMLHLRRKLAHE